MLADITALRETLLSLVSAHEAWRGSSLNLVAAENAMSPAARRLLASDLAQRYGDYTGRDPRARHYLGTQFIVQLEIEVARLAAEVFRAAYVELRPISGHIAGNSVLMAFCKPGDLVLEVGRYEGGHRIATKFAASPLIDLKVDYLPFDETAYNIDVPRTLEMVRAHRPRMLIVGASNFLFPVPLRELADGLRQFPDVLLVYDASHVLGLIAGGAFQEPLKEGAHLVLAGTQKSFPGPQGGVIYTDNEALIKPISSAVYPSLLSNHHLARLPSLGLALAEMKIWGAAYAAQTIRNAQALAQGLVAQGLALVKVPHRAGNPYTESHTVLLKTASVGDAEALGEKLEEAQIIVTTTRLPQSMGGVGLRFGVNEITRRGATEADMPRIAGLIADVLFARRSLEAVRADVHELAGTLNRYAFTWDTPDQTSPGA